MKKIVALLPLIAVLGLAGCEGKDDSEGGDHLEYSSEEVQQKVKTLGDTKGYEITFEISSSDSEKESYVIGAKEHFYWGYNGDSKGMYHLENDMLQMYEYNSDAGQFEKVGVEYSIAGTDYEESLRVGYNFYLCMGSAYAESDGLTKVKETTFVGRPAIEYSLKYASVYGAASYDLVIDKETGVTLKWVISGTSFVDGESGSASFEAKSFKTGADVSVPKHD